MSMPLQIQPKQPNFIKTQQIEMDPKFGIMGGGGCDTALAIVPSWALAAEGEGDGDMDIIITTTCHILLIDCLLIALDAPLFSHNGYGPGNLAQGPKAAVPQVPAQQLLGPGPSSRAHIHIHYG